MYVYIARGSSVCTKLVAEDAPVALEDEAGVEARHRHRHAGAAVRNAGRRLVEVVAPHRDGRARVDEPRAALPPPARRADRGRRGPRSGSARPAQKRVYSAVPLHVRPSQSVSASAAFTCGSMLYGRHDRPRRDSGPAASGTTARARHATAVRSSRPGRLPAAASSATSPTTLVREVGEVQRVGDAVVVEVAGQPRREPLVVLPRNRPARLVGHSVVGHDFADHLAGRGLEQVAALRRRSAGRGAS